MLRINPAKRERIIAIGGRRTMRIPNDLYDLLDLLIVDRRYETYLGALLACAWLGAMMSVLMAPRTEILVNLCESLRQEKTKAVI